MLDELDGSVAAAVYLQLVRAHRRQGNIEKAEETLRRGRNMVCRQGRHHRRVYVLVRIEGDLAHELTLRCEIRSTIGNRMASRSAATN